MLQPTEYEVLYCHEGSLNQPESVIDGPKCKNVTIEAKSGVQFATLDTLEPFSEYNITIQGRVEPFKRSSRSIQFFARTCKTFY